jgi:quercetin dioxygenase-like cupin family protein
MIIADVKDTEEVESRDEIVDLSRGKVSRQMLISHKETGGPGIVMVHFSKGARLNFHIHSGDQILYITAGKGMVATRDKEYVVTPGMVVYIPAGEVHWHGATADSTCSQIAVYHGDSRLP